MIDFKWFIFLQKSTGRFVLTIFVDSAVWDSTESEILHKFHWFSTTNEIFM